MEIRTGVLLGNKNGTTTTAAQSPPPPPPRPTTTSLDNLYAGAQVLREDRSQVGVHHGQGRVCRGADRRGAQGPPDQGVDAGGGCASAGGQGHVPHR